MTTHFSTWLRRQTHRDDPVGDLARDAKADRDWPGPTSDLQALQRHLALKRACPEARAALKRAHREWCDGTAPPSDGKLTDDERAKLQTMVRAQGVVAARRDLGIGANSLDRAFGGMVPVRPSTLWRIRERLSMMPTSKPPETGATCAPVSEDEQPHRVPCEVHYHAASFHVGRALASVGFCLLYDGGPHVLLTLRQGVPDLVEVALTPDQADALARKLQRCAANMRREQAVDVVLEDAPAPATCSVREREQKPRNRGSRVSATEAVDGAAPGRSEPR